MENIGIINENGLLSVRVCHGFRPGLSNEPKNIKIGPEMSEISLKQCFSHISFVSGPIFMFLGSLESHGVATGSTRDKPYLALENVMFLVLPRVRPRYSILSRGSSKLSSEMSSGAFFWISARRVSCLMGLGVKLMILRLPSSLIPHLLPQPCPNFLPPNRPPVTCWTFLASGMRRPGLSCCPIKTVWPRCGIRRLRGGGLMSSVVGWCVAVLSFSGPVLTCS